jgi:hypothetical protein
MKKRGRNKEKGSKFLRTLFHYLRNSISVNIEVLINTNESKGNLNGRMAGTKNPLSRFTNKGKGKALVTQKEQASYPCFQKFAQLRSHLPVEKTFRLFILHSRDLPWQTRLVCSVLSQTHLCMLPQLGGSTDFNHQLWLSHKWTLFNI